MNQSVLRQSLFATSFGQPEDFNYDIYHLQKHQSPFSSIEPEKNARGQKPKLFENPDKWFDFHSNANDLLSKEKLVNYLCQNLEHSINCEEIIRKKINSIWNLYDDDYTGSIEKNKFVGNKGLIQKLLSLGFEKTRDEEISQKTRKEFHHKNISSKTVEDTINGKTNATKNMRKIRIPSGMKTGDLLQYYSASRGQLLTFKIPDKRAWAVNETGYYFHALF